MNIPRRVKRPSTSQVFRLPRVLLGALVFSIAGLATAPLSAAPRKRSSGKTSAAVKEALGPLKWGMSQEAALKKLEQLTREEYAPKLKKVPGAIEEDRLRKKMQGDVQQLYKSQVRFDGSTTGWDSSFLRDEYWHGRGETMVVRNGDNAKNYYFFRNGKLWKWYRAYDASVFVGKSFADVRDALSGKYGKSREVKVGNKKMAEWTTRTTRIRLSNETEFYGFYGLVFESRAAARVRDKQGPPRAKAGGERHLVDGVLKDEHPTDDGNEDVVDRITGKIRVRRQGPDKGSKRGSAKGKKPARSGGKKSNRSTGNDPLSDTVF